MTEIQTIGLVFVLGIMMMIAIRYFKRKQTTVPIDLDGDGMDDKVFILIEHLKDELTASKMSEFVAFTKAALSGDMKAAYDHAIKLTKQLAKSRDETPYSIFDEQFDYLLAKRLDQPQGLESVSQAVKDKVDLIAKRNKQVEDSNVIPTGR